MNTVVCVKQIPDTSSSIRLNRRTGSIETKGIPYIVNPYDLLAVEEAIRLKEACGSGEVCLLSLGPPSAREALCSCLASGADRAILLCDSAFDDGDSYATAMVLAKAISSLQYDLILCGVRADDTNAGQVGAVIAEMLGIPLVCGVVKVEVSTDQKKVVAQRKLERGDREIIETSLPALLTVEAGLNKPRYPSLRLILTARRKEIDEWDLKKLKLSPTEVGTSGSKTSLLRLSPPRPKKIFTPDASLSATERLQLIMTGGIADKDGHLLRGNADEAASRIVQFLKQQKLAP